MWFCACGAAIGGALAAGIGGALLGPVIGAIASAAGRGPTFSAVVLLAVLLMDQARRLPLTHMPSRQGLGSVVRALRRFHYGPDQERHLGAVRYRGPRNFRSPVRALDRIADRQPAKTVQREL